MRISWNQPDGQLTQKRVRWRTAKAALAAAKSANASVDGLGTAAVAPTMLPVGRIELLEGTTSKVDTEFAGKPSDSAREMIAAGEGSMPPELTRTSRGSLPTGYLLRLISQSVTPKIE